MGSGSGASGVRPVWSRAAASAGVFGLVLTGCSSGAEPDPGPTASVTSPGPSDAPTGGNEAADGTVGSVRVQVPYGASQVEFEVGPLIDLGEASLLRVNFINPAGNSDSLSQLEFSGLYDSRFTTARLVDGDAGTVELAGLIDEKAAGSGLPDDLTLVAAGSEREAFTVFGPQSGATVDVVLPYMGPVFDVPVVPVAQVGDQFAEVIGKLVPEPAAVEARVFDLESFSLGLTGEVERIHTRESVHVNVAADVLFAVDEWALSKKADASLERAAREIERSGAGSGRLLVIGHTDDVGSRPHNQKLSERRATSVADRMKKLSDLSGYEVQVEGRAFDEPRVTGTSQQARAQNRRVELVFEPGPEQDVVAETVELPIPESAGPTGTGADGVEVELGTEGTVRISLDEVVRRDGYLFGSVQLTGQSGDVSIPGLYFSPPGRDSRGSYNNSQTGSPTLFALVANDQWNYPLDYKSGPTYLGLVQPVFNSSLSADASYVLPVVWPDVSGGGSTVTMDAALPPREQDAQNQGSMFAEFRLTDIPISDG